MFFIINEYVQYGYILLKYENILLNFVIKIRKIIRENLNLIFFQLVTKFKLFVSETHYSQNKKKNDPAQKIFTQKLVQNLRYIQKHFKKSKFPIFQFDLN